MPQAKKIQNTTKFCRSIESLLRPTDHKVTLTKTFLFTFFFPQRTPCMTLVRSGKRGNEGGGRCGEKKKQTRSNSGKKKEKVGNFFWSRNIPPPFSESLWELFLDMCVELRKQEVYAEVQNNSRKKMELKKNCKCQPCKTKQDKKKVSLSFKSNAMPCEPRSYCYWSNFLLLALETAFETVA